jgi:tetraacyldisaccharide 4'-kinase
MLVHHGKSDHKYHFSLEFGAAVNLVTAEHRDMESFTAGKAHAVAGIGHPERFFRQLKALGVEVIEHAFPDHHAYTSSDIDYADNLPILMTEKDAVKCRQLQSDNTADDINENIWAVPVSAKLSDQLGTDLVELIKQR